MKLVVIATSAALLVMGTSIFYLSKDDVTDTTAQADVADELTKLCMIKLDSSIRKELLNVDADTATNLNTFMEKYAPSGCECKGQQTVNTIVENFGEYDGVSEKYLDLVLLENKLKVEQGIRDDQIMEVAAYERKLNTLIDSVSHLEDRKTMLLRLLSVYDIVNKNVGYCLIEKGFPDKEIFEKFVEN
ncbi:MAG: hypothetical protein AAGA76_10515 [Pseudomonadota bacterium]